MSCVFVWIFIRFATSFHFSLAPFVFSVGLIGLVRWTGEYGVLFSCSSSCIGDCCAVFVSLAHVHRHLTVIPIYGLFHEYVTAIVYAVLFVRRRIREQVCIGSNHFGYSRAEFELC